MTRKISLIIAMLITYLVNAQGIDESLYVFDFGLNYMPVKERTTYLYEQAFKGVTFAIKDEQQIKKASREYWVVIDNDESNVLLRPAAKSKLDKLIVINRIEYLTNLTLK